MTVVDTLEGWAAQVLELEKQMAVISLQLAELRVKLSFARRRHKQKILEKKTLLDSVLCLQRKHRSL